MNEFIILLGFSCLERFRVEKIPVVLAEAMAEFTEVPEVSWLPTSLRLLARDGLEQTQDRQCTQVMSLMLSMVE